MALTIPHLVWARIGGVERAVCLFALGRHPPSAKRMGFVGVFERDLLSGYLSGWLSEALRFDIDWSEAEMKRMRGGDLRVVK